NLPIIVTFRNFSGAVNDWIGLSTSGSADNTFVVFKNTGGGVNGSVTFTGLATAGNYEARGYFRGSATVSARTTFTVINRVSTSAASYSADQPVVVNYTGLPGAAGQYLTIAASGSANNSFVASQSAPGTSGTRTFSGIVAGTYVARAFTSGNQLLGQSATFTVSGTAAGGETASSSAGCYVTGAEVIINYTNMPGNVQDWISVAPSGS